MTKGERLSDYSIDFNNLIFAAHELKSPSSLIRQLALSIDDDNLTLNQKKSLHRIVLSAEKSLRLTTGLTKAANLTPELFPLEPLNVYQICEEVAAELQPLYQARGKRISVKKSRISPLMIANKDLVYQILLGFADNSLYYSKNNNLEFEIKTCSDRILTSLRDYGPKIKLDKEETTWAQRPESSGIGLKIASYFANFMNGQIGSISHKNGMTFYVDLAKSQQMRLFE